jgi:hypothetical protein
MMLSEDNLKNSVLVPIESVFWSAQLAPRNLAHYTELLEGPGHKNSIVSMKYSTVMSKTFAGRVTCTRSTLSAEWAGRCLGRLIGSRPAVHDGGYGYRILWNGAVKRYERRVSHDV